MSAELWAKIGELLLAWGTPGIIIIFLLEERRRLTNKVDALQTKLEASMQSKLDQAKEFWGLLKDYEKSFDSLSGTINAFLTSGRGRGRND